MGALGREGVSYERGNPGEGENRGWWSRLFQYMSLSDGDLGNTLPSAILYENSNVLSEGSKPERASVRDVHGRLLSPHIDVGYCTGVPHLQENATP